MDAMPKRSAKREPTTADKLRALIEASGKTQEAYAREFGVSIRTLRGWLYGDRTPNEMAVKYIDCLHARLPK